MKVAHSVEAQLDCGSILGASGTSGDIAGYRNAPTENLQPGLIPSESAAITPPPWQYSQAKKDLTKELKLKDPTSAF